MLRRSVIYGLWCPEISLVSCITTSNTRPRKEQANALTQDHIIQDHIKTSTATLSNLLIWVAVENVWLTTTGG
jgi:hypothetical protein